MCRFLIDCGPMAFVLAFLAGLVCIAPTPPMAPDDRPEALRISEHAAECHACGLPLHSSAGEPSRLGPEPSWTGSARRRAHRADERTLIYQAGQHTDGPLLVPCNSLVGG
jgi:hypothetical protein